MDKLVKITIFLTAISSSIFATPNQLYYEKVIPGGENIVQITPILDVENELSGFIYTDTTTNKVSISLLSLDSSYTVEIPQTPRKTIIRYASLPDTLILYTLSYLLYHKPQITISKFSNNLLVSQQTTTPPSNIGYDYLSGASYSSLLYNDLKFYPNEKRPTNIIYEVTFRTNNYYSTMGFESSNNSTSIIYNLDLSEIVLQSPESSIYPGNLFSENEKNYTFKKSHYFSYDYTDQNGDGLKGLQMQDILTTYDNFDIIQSELIANYGGIYSIHVDNFAPSSQTDELIIHANSVDLLGNYNSREHIACYSFADGYPVELWYNDESFNTKFSYVYKSKDILVGISDADKIVMLNYLNGKITDDSQLDLPLSHITFFETGNSQSILNLIGMSGDTIKAYKFDISTGIEENATEYEIPTTFTLFQNHPNPFNGETRLEFSNQENQYLKLSIFNILGQEINVITDAQFSPGIYSFYWDGKDEHGLDQSTGIYFARLESELNSQMIKLIYLK